jgi:DegV family protein with EDD domain
MSQIAIITDTDCSIPLSLSKKLGIKQVPILVQFCSETHEAVFSLNDEEAFERIDQDQQLPKTSAPSPGAFETAYQSAFDNGADSIICFCVSGEMSATYTAALNARELHPDKDITVIDTQSLSMAQGFAVLAAAEAAAQGASKEEAIEAAINTLERTQLFAALSTLKYLAMSGRVGSLAAGMAEFLNIMPILTIKSGRLEMLERTRTRKKAWKRLLSLSMEAVGSAGIEKMAIVHVDALDTAKEFEAMLRSKIDCPDEILFAELTPGLSVHTGAGLVGLAILHHEA